MVRSKEKETNKLETGNEHSQTTAVGFETSICMNREKLAKERKVMEGGDRIVIE